MRPRISSVPIAPPSAQVVVRKSLANCCMDDTKPQLPRNLGIVALAFVCECELVHTSARLYIALTLHCLYVVAPARSAENRAMAFAAADVQWLTYCVITSRSRRPP